MWVGKSNKGLGCNVTSRILVPFNKWTDVFCFLLFFFLSR